MMILVKELNKYYSEKVLSFDKFSLKFQECQQSSQQESKCLL